MTAAPGPAGGGEAAGAEEGGARPAPALVAVASGNPVKIESARRGLARFGIEPRVVSAPVPSGVPAQPSGDAETLRGARNRARGALEAAPDADLAFGMEGGIDDGPDGMISFAWIVARDRAGREGRARTAAFEVPPRAAELVRSGLELGDAIDAAYGSEDAKRKGGAVGIASGATLGRTELYEVAALLAAAALLRPDGDARGAELGPDAGAG